MTEMVYDFSAEGTVEGMYHDNFNLGFLGKQEVSRASEIIHNPETQKWDIIVTGDNEPCCDAAVDFDGYDEARAFEVTWFNESRKREVKPNSLHGCAIAAQLRAHGECTYQIGVYL